MIKQNGSFKKENLMEKTKIKVVCGDIAKLNADAIITTINSCGVMSFGQVDSSIMRVANNSFHYQVQQSMPLFDNKVVIAEENSENKGNFKKVVFVVDCYKKPLREILYRGLMAAEKAGLESVLIPTIRMDSTLGIVEKSLNDVACEIAAAIQEFLENSSNNLKSITFVVYKDRIKKELLQQVFLN